MSEIGDVNTGNSWQRQGVLHLLTDETERFLRRILRVGYSINDPLRNMNARDFRFHEAQSSC